jgi:hypothetical protein
LSNISKFSLLYATVFPTRVTCHDIVVKRPRPLIIVYWINWLHIYSYVMLNIAFYQVLQTLKFRNYMVYNWGNNNKCGGNVTYPRKTTFTPFEIDWLRKLVWVNGYFCTFPRNAFEGRRTKIERDTVKVNYS